MTTENTMTTSWNDLLQETRRTRNDWDSASPPTDSIRAFWWETIPPHFSFVAQQLDDYERALRRHRHRNHWEASISSKVDVEKSDNHKHDDNHHHYSTSNSCELSLAEKKQLVLDTRLALRFGLSCLSVTDDSIRTFLQQYACSNDCRWHIRLASILSYKVGGDTKCRLLAAQLLSNLVTANGTTARQMIQDVALAPSEETISRRLLESLSNQQEHESEAQLGDNNDCNNSMNNDFNDNDDKPSWVDMVLAASSCSSAKREMLGAVVTALHNCTASLLLLTPKTSNQTPCCDDDDDDNDELTFTATTVTTTTTTAATDNSTNDTINMTTSTTALDWAHQVSSNPMLVSTLLRQVLPATTILRQSNISSSTPPPLHHTNGDENDDAGTEWIVRFLMLLCRLGNLPQLYVAAAGSAMSWNHSEDNNNNKDWSRVVPEQVVLLYCVEKTMDEYTAARHHHLIETRNVVLEEHHPLGGGELDAIVLSHRFLVKLFYALHDALPSTWTLMSNSSTMNTAITSSSPTQLQLQRAALVSILQILADSLGMEQTKVSAKLRQELAGAPETGLLSCLCRDLAVLYDTIADRKERPKSRGHYHHQQRQRQPPSEQQQQNNNFQSGSAGAYLELTADEQLLLTLLVRCLGNFCFQCSSNQDLMRLTLVPRVPLVATAAAAGEPKDCGDDDAIGSTPSTTCAIDTSSRTALHVVMSCTSLGAACFTLREWAVVALRSILQDNTGNQNLAAQLEAQQPVQTAELEQMGIRVDMDSQGKVSVVPLDEHDPDGNDKVDTTTATINNDIDDKSEP